MERRTLQRGATVRISCCVKTWAGDNFTPDAGVKVTVLNPNGVAKVTTQVMAEVSQGCYVYFYASAADDVRGWWKCTAKVQHGTKVALETSGFQLN